MRKLIVDSTAKIELVEKALEKKELESKLKVLTDFLVTIIEREKLFINTSKFYSIDIFISDIDILFINNHILEKVSSKRFLKW